MEGWKWEKLAQWKLRFWNNFSAQIAREEAAPDRVKEEPEEASSLL